MSAAGAIVTAPRSSSPVVAYLRELDIAGRDLPQALRVELRARTVRDLLARVGAAPAEGEVAAVLAEFGEPVDLVAAERETYGLEADPLLPRDVAAVYLLATGPFLLGLGVLGGLVLLLSSRRWPLRQRAIATGLLMVGAAAPLAALPFVPILKPLVALLVGGLVVGPWSASAYLAALRLGRRMRAARHIERQGVV